VKLLVVTPQPVHAAMLRSTLGDEVRGAEALVISPVVFSHPGGDRDYREDAGLAGAQERFGVPVEHAVIGR
jgi:hypothetical protein